MARDSSGLMSRVWLEGNLHDNDQCQRITASVRCHRACRVPRWRPLYRWACPLPRRTRSPCPGVKAGAAVIPPRWNTRHSRGRPSVKTCLRVHPRACAYPDTPTRSRASPCPCTVPTEQTAAQNLPRGIGHRASGAFKDTIHTVALKLGIWLMRTIAGCCTPTLIEQHLYPPIICPIRR